MNIIDINTINEGEAIDAVRALSKRFGWSTRVLTRADAANAYDGTEAEGALSDYEWGKVSASGAWGDLAEVSEDDWLNIHDAVYGILGQPEERKVAEDS